MARETKFTCDCGQEADQGKRGRLRTKCPDCMKAARIKYLADYYQRKKSVHENPAEAVA